MATREIHYRPMPPEIRKLFDDTVARFGLDPDQALRRPWRSRHPQTLAAMDAAAAEIYLHGVVNGRRVTLDRMGEWLGRERSTIHAAINRHRERSRAQA